ncbi:MAG TPA: NAD-dependent epimerase/dehydratase family protein [Phycisphaerales bacterium]|nr:NAD-dependent epimerase/dehydratase family protein [Phycisphaerales bacterium]
MSANAAKRAILVTGGAGFIGSHLVEHLVRQGERVVVVDDLSTGRTSNLRNVPERAVQFIHARVSEALAHLAPGDFSTIYHLAASVGVRLVIEQPIHTVENNILETSAVLEFASREHTPLLLASTSEIYGKGSKTPFCEDDDVVYGPTIYSRWSYAVSKAIDEYLALAYHRSRNLPVVIARFFNTVGPRQVGEYGMVLPRFVESALTGRALEVHGDGQQSRCFCDVRDVVEVLPTLMGTKACEGRIFNVGSDQSITILALAELVLHTLGSNSRLQLVPYAEAFGAGFDDLRERRPSIARLHEATGFAPKIALVQTIRDLAKEIADNRSGAVETAVR